MQWSAGHLRNRQEMCLDFLDGFSKTGCVGMGMCCEKKMMTG